MEHKTTIVIPTYKRENEFSNLMAYISEIRPETPVIVADSSPGYTSEKKGRYAEERLANVTYISEGYGKNDFVKKIYDALSLVRTKYVILCADDDFVSFDGIRFLEDHLEANRKVDVVSGKTISYCYNGTSTLFYHEYRRAFSIENGDLYKRIALHSQNYVPTFYSLHNAEFLRELFWLAMESNVEEGSCYQSRLEGFLSLLTASSGDVVFAKPLLNIRGGCSGNVNLDSAAQKVFFAKKPFGRYPQKKKIQMLGEKYSAIRSYLVKAQALSNEVAKVNLVFDIAEAIIAARDGEAVRHKWAQSLLYSKVLDLRKKFFYFFERQYEPANESEERIMRDIASYNIWR